MVKDISSFIQAPAERIHLKIDLTRGEPGSYLITRSSWPEVLHHPIFGPLFAREQHIRVEISPEDKIDVAHEVRAGAGKRASEKGSKTNAHHGRPDRHTEKNRATKRRRRRIDADEDDEEDDDNSSEDKDVSGPRERPGRSSVQRRCR